MKYRFFILGLAAALFAACAVNEADHSTPAFNDGEEFYATIEGATTKVYVDEDLKVLWHADDRVSIFNKYTYNQQYRFTGNTGANSGSFQKVPSEDFITGNALDYVYAVYPYQEVTEISNQGLLTVELPATQSYAEDSFGVGANTMVSCSEGNELLFKNLCGYIMLKLYGDDVTVTSISLKGNRNEPLAGKATVTAGVEAAPELQMDASATQEVTLKMDTPVTLGSTAETATTFWLVVPPTTFEGGITLNVKTADGKQFEKSTTGRLDISRNTRSTMAALEVVPEAQIRYLTFTSEGTTTVRLSNYEGNAPVLYYSTDRTNWKQWNYRTLTFTGEQPLYLRGDNPEGFSSSTTKYSKFVTAGDNYSVSGDIMSLIDSEHETTTIPCEHCFDYLFQDCSGLTSAPDLPATTLAAFCYSYMFFGCTSLTSAPELPATTLADHCYYDLFRGCTSLTTAPELPATTLADYCYSGLFYGCSGLTAAPELPSTTLAGSCYNGMFYGCTSLATAPELPATTLAGGCYSYMFGGCTGLTTAPDLPATALAGGCYGSMFEGCTSLTKAPELPATALADWCYNTMFAGCERLTDAPNLPATTLADYCYAKMFVNTNLTTAPDLPATTLAERCYYNMFCYCTQLNYVKCLATDISAEECIDGWLDGVASTGTFVKAAEMDDWPRDISGIPVGWVMQNDDGSPYLGKEYLTFTSEGTTTLSLTNFGGNAPFLFFSTDRAHWVPWDYSELTFTSEMPLYLCGDNPEGFSSDTKYSMFATSGDNYSVSGDIMSLIDSAHELTAIPCNSCFRILFKDCVGLVAAPELPATTLAESCYSSMFLRCTSLTTAPELPATSLADGCYSSMFRGCERLTTAPELPATSLANQCYLGMFNGCIGLTTAPELPATTLRQDCYTSMFQGCTSLTTAPELPATTLAERCYSSMFYGCTSLATAPELPATTLAERCYYSMFYGCTSLMTAPELPATTLKADCYNGMFKGCTSLTNAPELPATTLASYCYYNMFGSCTSLMTAPELPATTLAPGCYADMFYVCTSLTTTPELPATTLADSCYYRMFYGCTQLNYVKCLATDIGAASCISNWLRNVASTGTFVKAPGVNWPTGADGIPAGWNVLDNSVIDP